MTLKRFPHYWSFVKKIQWSPEYSPHKGPVTRNFEVLFISSLNKLLNKQPVARVGRHLRRRDAYVSSLYWDHFLVLTVHREYFFCRQLVGILLCHCNEVAWTTWCLKSSSTRLFLQELVPTNNKKQTNALHYRLFGFASQRASNAECVSMPWRNM